MLLPHIRYSANYTYAANIYEMFQHKTVRGLLFSKVCVEPYVMPYCMCDQDIQNGAQYVYPFILFAKFTCYELISSLASGCCSSWILVQGKAEYCR
jgi:hypothetical protein